MSSIKITIATTKHLHYAEEISLLISKSAVQRGTGIAHRSPEYIRKKISEGEAVIALHRTELAGFCYIESWENKKYVANSGLVVHPNFRSKGYGNKIKKTAFQLSRKKYPNSKLFGLTTSLSVMKINSKLGYNPVTYEELTTDQQFWDSCKSCVNYEILNSKSRKNCMCTAMVFEPKKKKVKLLGMIKKRESKQSDIPKIKNE